MSITRQLFTRKNVRFKTLEEMRHEFGEDWAHLYHGLSAEAAILTMACYQGKVFYSSLISEQNTTKASFLYGPTLEVVHMNMLTTRGVIKYDMNAIPIKVRSVMTLHWNISIAAYHIPLALRNEPGTVVQVLKVIDPYTTFWSLPEINIKDKLNLHVVATTLVKPRSGQSLAEVQEQYEDYFVNGRVIAFETTYNLRRASKLEKQFYNKTYIHGNNT
jgi:hypothetical protein